MASLLNPCLSRSSGWPCPMGTCSLYSSAFPQGTGSWSGAWGAKHVVDGRVRRCCADVSSYFSWLERSLVLSSKFDPSLKHRVGEIASVGIDFFPFIADRMRRSRCEAGAFHASGRSAFIGRKARLLLGPSLLRRFCSRLLTGAVAARCQVVGNEYQQ